MRCWEKGAGGHVAAAGGCWQLGRDFFLAVCAAWCCYVASDIHRPYHAGSKAQEKVQAVLMGRSHCGSLPEHVATFQPAVLFCCVAPALRQGLL